MRERSFEISGFAVTDLLLLFTVTSWGSGYLFTKIGLVDLHPLIFASYRTHISAPVFLLTLRSMEGKITFEAKHVCVLLLTGMSGHFLNRICWTYGIYFTTVSKASILWSTSPIFVGIISLIMKWEKQQFPRPYILDKGSITHRTRQNRVFSVSRARSGHAYGHRFLERTTQFCPIHWGRVDLGRGLPEPFCLNRSQWV